ncbi:hypothetical protein [Paenibacillus thalictri]|uniref:SRPBCC family protein n=1 Tax=Paenibacillus thalictri TaxID=2527873 RepID=A0A4Q9DJU3_9BACL|nr:hypothetical protein [Paenibacillus thalictri]TBL74677.1 hypothetical protein EYB31_25525 [Paenibacillus thalictri]
MSERAKDIIKGILISNIFALVCVGVTYYIINVIKGIEGFLVLSEFVLLPMIVGIINSYFWRRHKISAGPSFGYGFLNLIVVVAVSFFFMGEGVICIVIVSPLIYLFIMAGILCGKFMFNSNKHTLNISILAALSSMFLVNMITAAPSNDLVADRIVINASPQTVWQHVVSFPPIEDEPKFWLFQLGLPSPLQSTAEGSYLGAERKCIFSNGIVFDEKIVEYEPNLKLTFDITKQPDDPEILGHLNLIRGQFLLQDNGDGTTTLIGNSWYDLKIKPSFYFDLWTQSIISNVHIRVMNHIKELSENT